MLSITGMTLEQFADLMEGLGYKAEKGERPKVKAEAAPADASGQAPAEEASEASAEETPVEEAPAQEETPTAEAAPEEAAEAAEPEVEVFFTFTWGRKPQRQGGGGRPQGQRPQGGKPRGKGKPRRDGGQQKSKNFSARPPKKEKAIDPDNPFAAALMGLKGKD